MDASSDRSLHVQECSHAHRWLGHRAVLEQSWRMGQTSHARVSVIIRGWALGPHGFWDEPRRGNLRTPSHAPCHLPNRSTALLSARVRSRSVTIGQHDKHSSILAIVFFAACRVPRRAELCHFWHGPRASERRGPGVRRNGGRVCSQHASRAADQGQPGRGLAVEQVIQFH